MLENIRAALAQDIYILKGEMKLFSLALLSMDIDILKLLV